MKNLNLFWNQLFASESNNNQSVRPGTEALETEPSTHNDHDRRHSADNIADSKRKKFLRRLISSRSPTGRRHSSVSTSSSSSSSYSDSVSSWSALSFYNAPQEHQKQQIVAQRRAVSCCQIDDKSLARRSSSAEPARHHHHRHSTGPAAIHHEYQHHKLCRCSVCLLQSQLRSHEKLTLPKIEIIREEIEEEDSNQDNTNISNTEMFLESSKPIRPVRRKATAMDGIEPFQKPEKLQHLWQEPQESTRWHESSLYIAAKDGNDDGGGDGDKTNNAKRFLDDHQLAAGDASMATVNIADDGRNSSASTAANNFIRTNQLRSSCPPPARRRKVANENDQEQQQRRRIKSPSQNANQVTGGRPNSSTGLVDALHTRINAAVRKSWLSSFFHSFNSKEKQSTWKKSDDFEAEFFDRHTELTESLVNRRSPLNFDHLNRSNDRHDNQMASSMYLETVAKSNESVAVTSAVTTTVDDLAKYQPSFLRRPSSTGANARPRPRSACLDTYMLRMRNGNFIEYTLDSESKDETCSIISSNPHLACGDIIDPRRKNNCSNAAINELETSDFGSQQRRNYLRKNNNFQIDYEKNNHNHNSNGNLYRRSSPIKSVNSNSMLSTVNTSSSLFSKPTVSSTTATASSLSSSYTTKTSPQDPSMASYSFQRSTSIMFSSNNQNVTSVIIYWPVKNFTEIRIGPQHTALDVIKTLLASQVYTENLSLTRNSIPNLPLPEQVTVWAYSLRFICRTLNPKDHVWIHPTKNMLEFLDQNQSFIEKGWKIELRIRYIPPNIEELYRNDFPTFKFLYEQVLEEFLALEMSPTKIQFNQDLILELGCYEIFRTHPYLTPQGLEKNSNWDALENGFNRIFPISFINEIKSKQLRKMIKSKYKKIYSMKPERVMFNFLNLVTQLINFHREVFHCSLGESVWCVPVDLMIGPNMGMAYFTSNSSPATVIVKSFNLIEQINIVSYSTMNKNNGEEQTGTTSKKILLNLQIKDTEDLLSITCSSFSMAQSIADLIDGYHRLATRCQDSIWLNIISEKSATENTDNSESGINSLRSNSSEIIEPKRADFGSNISDRKPFAHSKPEEDEVNIMENQENSTDADYSNPIETCLEVQRENLRIGDLIGNGQFGDVYKGVFCKPKKDSLLKEDITVAIKISRVQPGSIFGKNDIHVTDQKLLCEAERMHRLDHHNIIKLIGVCSNSPVYVIMELAEYGELRNFLLKHGSQLEQRRLIEYSYQIASAMAYLESKQFVHRDIAARNVLVFSFDSVKLADFGLSRYIEDASYYMATNSKLPIKWMAPESINFRRFTTASDVWMFGVCIWEIFMLGKKPFPGVKNCDVIGLIECGDRLPKPSRCPDQLYDLMLKCWRYEPDRRPTFRVIKKKIYDIYQNELGLIGAIARIDLTNDLGSSKSSLSSLSKDVSSSTSSSLSRIHSSIQDHSLPSVTEHTKSHLSQSESNLSLNASTSARLDSEKIKEILNEQRRQMEEDQKWLKQNDFKWHSSPSNTMPKNGMDHAESVEDSTTTTTSIYEDASSDKNNTQRLYSMPNMQTKTNRSGGSYNSFKSTKSSFDQNSNPSTSSSVDSGDDCGLSVSLRKFFKHNQLTNAKVREEMMDKVNCASADVDRKNDPVYWSTISVVNSVRYLLKGVQELNTQEYIDLVKNVGFELRNLLANVDIFLETIPKEEFYRTITVGQKKLSTDMNDLVESMKKAITYSETPMEGAYKQNMLEASYVLVIDSKNLMDSVDDVRLKMKNQNDNNPT